MNPIDGTLSPVYNLASKFSNRAIELFFGGLFLSGKVLQKVILQITKSFKDYKDQNPSQKSMAGFNILLLKTRELLPKLRRTFTRNRKNVMCKFLSTNSYFIGTKSYLAMYYVSVSHKPLFYLTRGSSKY